jgi:hypothetical protein
MFASVRQVFYGAIVTFFKSPTQSYHIQEL